MLKFTLWIPFWLHELLEDLTVFNTGLDLIKKSGNYFQVSFLSLSPVIGLSITASKLPLSNVHTPSYR